MTRSARNRLALPHPDDAALDLDDPVLTAALPTGFPGVLLDYEALYRVYEDGEYRGEWLAQDTEETVVPDSDGLPQLKIAGPDTLSVLGRQRARWQRGAGGAASGAGHSR